MPKCAQKKNRLEPPSRRPISSETPTGLKTSLRGRCRKSRRMSEKLSDLSALVGEPNTSANYSEARVLMNYLLQGLVQIDFTTSCKEHWLIWPSSCNRAWRCPERSPKTVA